MRKIIVEAICISFVLLFVYTAVSKMLDYENFKAVIGQSPLITKFTDVIAVLVPGMEIMISILLIIPKYRLVALISSFGLMVAFTAYIIILVTLSEKVPCSCGGVIQKMSWGQHIFFNLFFIAVALIGVFLQSKSQYDQAGGNRLFNV